MPRKESKLVPFLRKALEKNIQNEKENLSPKYRNLNYVDKTKSVFRLYFPHKKETLHKSYELIFKDWYAETGRRYTFNKDYSVARQGMTQALRKSNYVNMKKQNNNKLTVWILTKEEVKEKKRMQKLNREQEKIKKCFFSDSDDDSSVNSLQSSMDEEENNADIWQDTEDDSFSPPTRVSPEGRNLNYYKQNYNKIADNSSADSMQSSMDEEGNNTDIWQDTEDDSFSLPTRVSPEGSLNYDKQKYNKIADTSGAFKPSGLDQSFDINQMIDTYGLFKPFSPDSSEIESNAMDGCWDHDLSDIPANSEKDDTLEDLFKIPNEQFIGSGFQKLQLASKVPALIDAKAKNICKHCEVIEGIAILIGQLLEDMDTYMADASEILHKFGTLRSNFLKVTKKLKFPSGATGMQIQKLQDFAIVSSSESDTDMSITKETETDSQSTICESQQTAEDFVRGDVASQNFPIPEASSEKVVSDDTLYYSTNTAPRKRRQSNASGENIMHSLQARTVDASSVSNAIGQLVVNMSQSLLPPLNEQFSNKILEVVMEFGSKQNNVYYK